MSAKTLMSGLAAGLVAAMAPGTAWAHEGASHASGLAFGFAHPLSGPDHLLAMVAVGLFAAGLGGRAIWSVPLAFLGLMAVGGLAGAQGVALPFAESGIALSVLVLGALVASQVRWPVALATLLAGLFAVFHGHAHGAEMPFNASGIAYATGFLAATALLHLTGLALAALAWRAGASHRSRLAQWSGGAIALAGIAIMTGVL